MLSSTVPLTVYDNRPSLRVRLAAWLLSLGVVTLMLATLIAMGMLDRLPGGPAQRFTAVRLTKAAEKTQQKAQTRAESAKAHALVSVPKPVPAPVPIPKIPPIKIIPMSKADFAAADISALSQPQAASAGLGAAGGGSSYGPGEGPGGAKLYNAEWYREPSHAELSGYMKSGAPPGSWAMIACKTVEDYHVENCQQLGESPPGSGLSRSLRLAAWQFLVRPPRIDGKPIIGAWVRIRFDFTRKPEAADE